MFSSKKTMIASVIMVFIVLLSLNVTSFATIGMSESEPNNSYSTATVIPSGYDLTQEISGSIGTAGDVDYYKFTPLNSAGYSIETLGTTDTFGYLYDSNMNLLDQCDNQLYPNGINLELRYNLTANNTYYIKVTHKETTGTGNYTLKITPVNYKYQDVEPNDTFETAVIPVWGNHHIPLEAEIGTAGDEDYYRLSFSGGGSYTIETTGSIDTYGYLYDSNHNQIAYDDDSGEGTNMKMVYTLSGRQTYYVKIRHWSSSGTGSYGLKVTPPHDASSNDWEGSDFSSATQLTTENYVSHSGMGANYANDTDYFKFTPSEDGVYTFQSTGFSDTYGEVYDSNQTFIKSDDNNGPGNNFMIDVRLLANQTYYLKVSVQNGATGSYGIDIARGRCLPVPQFIQLPFDNLCWATATSMAIAYFNNNSVDHTLDIAKDRAQTVYTSYQTTYGPDYYNYPAVFNQREYLLYAANYVSTYVQPAPYIQTHESTGGNPRDGAVYNYSLDELMKSIDNGYPMLLKVSNPTGGAHVIIVKGYKENRDGINVIYNDPLDGEEHMVDFDYAGSLGYTTFYPLYADIEPNDAKESAGNIWPDDPIQGSIWKSGDVDFYGFWVNPNNQYTIETTGSTDTYGELYDSDGKLVASSDNGGQGNNFKIQLHLDPYKKYYIKVRHSGSGTGDYTLNLSYTNPQ